MTVKMMREYPNLPLLPMDKSMQVLKTGNVGAKLAADLTGLSRVAFFKWAKGEAINPNAASLEAVSALAYKVLRALKYRHFPLQKSRFIDASTIEALRDRFYTKALSDTSPQELLPKAWLDQFNLPRDQYEPESVL